jgi:hypothetical protein
MKYVFESLSEQKRIPLSEVTWDDVSPKRDPDLPKWKWQKDTVDLPNDFQSSEQFRSEAGFERWYRDFTKRWGTDGELVETRPTYWKLEGNTEWDKAYKRGTDAVSRYYDEKGSGGFTGD